MIRQKFEDNLRILANFGKFSRKNSKINGFRPYLFKKFLCIFLIKIIFFYTKNLFIWPKNWFQIIFYNEKYKKFRKNQFFSNIFTFLSVIRQNFEDNLRILANFGKFSRKISKIYGFRPYVFKKLQVFFFVFFNKDYTFYTKNLIIRPKNCVQSILYNERCKEFCKNQFFSNIFTFLSATRQNFEDNLRILANFGKFSRKNSKFYIFRPYVFKKLVFLYFFFLIKIIVFTLKIFSFSPKIAFISFFYNKRCKKFCKNQFFSNIFTFLSVIRQNFEYNLRILANFGKFSRRKWISPIRFQKTRIFFFVFLNIDYTFYTKNLFIRPKNCVQSILYNERWKNFRKNQFFSNIFTFLSVIRQNFEYNLRILANFGKFSRRNSKIYGFRPYVFKKLEVFFLYFLI